MSILFALLFLAPAYGQDPPTAKVLELKPAAPPVTAGPEGAAPAFKVIDAYVKGGSTHLIVQSPQELVVGRSLYIGKQETPVTIGELLSEKGSLYVYHVSAPGTPRLAVGDAVLLETTRKESVPSAILGSLSARKGFEQKSVVEIRAVQGDRAMIDKGTMQQIHEHDLYRILDASGTYKGYLEVRGIGDLQSSAILDVKRGFEVRPGDYGTFVGRRRELAFGPIVSAGFKNRQISYARETSLGGGLLMGMTFYNGWGIETVLGYFNRQGKDEGLVVVNTLTATPVRETQRSSRSAKLIAPTWVKKNFNYPGLVSPFLAAGAYWLDMSSSFEVFSLNGNYTTASYHQAKRGLYPVIGAGIELFPARFFKPRVEVRHFIAPKTTAGGNEFKAEGTYYAFSITTSW